MGAETQKPENNVAQPGALEERECFQEKPVFDDWVSGGGRYGRDDVHFAGLMQR
jgi:hypothetical protein